MFYHALSMPKLREHADEEDAARQKYHEAAVGGKFRSKRRGGVSLDDSESEDEDDYDNKRRREKMYKKRKIEGDTLEALGESPTQHFG